MRTSGSYQKPAERKYRVSGHEDAVAKYDRPRGADGGSSVSTPAGRALVDRLAQFLDNAIPIPGTNWRIGFDGLIGLIPGFGDAIGAAASAFIIYTSARAGAPVTVLVRMLANVLMDSIAGAFPVLGDIFDLAFKSNARNAKLLQSTLAAQDRAPRTNRQVAFLFGTIAAAIAILVPLAIVTLLIWLFEALRG
jgi:hypothetical protein